MDLQSSSFINVTLAFWTNENGLAIAPQALQKHEESEESQVFDSSKSNNSGEKHAQHLSKGNSGHNSIDPTFQHLINSLLSEQFSGAKNETLFKNNNDVNSGVIANVSEFAKKVFDNVTDATNDTLLCFSSGCLLNNETHSTVQPSSRPDRVYWALFLVILPILALFGNILVILSVYRERSLQTVTNWFIVSLAFADLFVTIPMVFSLYVMHIIYYKNCYTILMTPWVLPTRLILTIFLSIVELFPFMRDNKTPEKELKLLNLI